MAKRFDTLIDVYDHILPTWSKWDLLTVAPAEQCKALNIEGASRYRLSDGKHAVEIWVILDFEGIYRRAPMELEIEFNKFLDYPVGKSPVAVAASARTDESAISASHTSISSQQLTRTKLGKSQTRQSLIDSRLQNVT